MWVDIRHMPLKVLATCYTALQYIHNFYREFNMYLLMMGIAALLMKYLEFGAVAAWPWWLVLSPFALAVVWWWLADTSGYTKRVEMKKMDKRKQDRIDKQREAMGMLSAKSKSRK